MEFYSDNRKFDKAAKERRYSRIALQRENKRGGEEEKRRSPMALGVVYSKINLLVGIISIFLKVNYLRMKEREGREREGVRLRVEKKIKKEEKPRG